MGNIGKIDYFNLNCVYYNWVIKSFDIKMKWDLGMKFILLF